MRGFRGWVWICCCLVILLGGVSHASEGTLEKLRSIQQLLDGATEASRKAVLESFKVKEFDLKNVAATVNELEHKLLDVSIKKKEATDTTAEVQKKLQARKDQLMSLKEKLGSAKQESVRVQNQNGEAWTKMKEEDIVWETERAETKRLVNMVQALLDGLNSEIVAVKQLKNPELESWFLNQAEELGQYLESPLTTDLIRASVDFASSTYNSTAGALQGLATDTGVEPTKVPRFVKMALMMIFLCIGTLVLVYVWSRLKSQHVTNFNLVAYAVFSCIALALAKRDQANAQSDQTVSVGLLGAQLIMLAFGWVGLVVGFGVPRLDKADKLVHWLQVVVLFSTLVTYHRTVLDASLYGDEIDAAFIYRSIFSCASAIVVAFSSTFMTMFRRKRASRYSA